MTVANPLLTDLLAVCRARGIRLEPGAGDALVLEGPRDALTPDLVERLRAHKADLLAMLRPSPADPIRGRRRSERPSTCQPDGRCKRCGRSLWLERADAAGLACARCQRPADPTQVRGYVAGLELADLAPRRP